MADANSNFVVKNQLQVNGSILTTSPTSVNVGTVLSVGNSTSNIVANNSSLYISVTGAIAKLDTANGIGISNSTSSFSANLSSIFIGNSSSNVVANSTSLKVGSNVTLNTSVLSIGNSTFATVANSTYVATPQLYTSGNASISGNLVVNQVYTNYIGFNQNGTSYSVANLTAYQVGNSVAQATIRPNQITVLNTSVTSTWTPNSFSVNGYIHSDFVKVKYVNIGGGGSYTFTYDDSGCYIWNTGTGITYYIISTSLASGFRCIIGNSGSGTIQIANGTGTALFSRTGNYSCSTGAASVSVLMVGVTGIIDGYI